MKKIAGLNCPESWNDITTEHYVTRLLDMKIHYFQAEDGSISLKDVEDYWELIMGMANVDEVPDMTVEQMKEFFRTTMFIHQDIPDLKDQIAIKTNWWGRKQKPEFRDLGKLPFDEFMVLDKYIQGGGNPLYRLIDILSLYTKMSREQVAALPITHTYALFFSLLENTKSSLEGMQYSLKAQIAMLRWREKLLRMIGSRRKKTTSSK